MKNHIKLRALGLAIITAFALALSVVPARPASASATLTFSTAQEVTLYPGQKSKGSVMLSSPASSLNPIYYSAKVQGFSETQDEGMIALNEENTGYYNIVNWVTLDNPTGTIEPNQAIELVFNINVPEDAPGGGQYFAVVVTWQEFDPEVGLSDPNNGNVTIGEIYQVSSRVYATVSGSNLVTSGNIKNNEISPIFLNPPIKGSFFVENTGNTHASIIYTMQVYPLFSNEEVYTTEENPNSVPILPGGTRYISQSWSGSPQLGIFRVVQKAYFGSTENDPSVTEKIVVIAPVWLLLIILAIIFVAIFWVISRITRRKRD